ncbi:hypothetical protein EXU57_02070 [Segetibacter sp. 3557_3]|uniref:hypothetical protein n=1 Tax=Segetibacter sp. 3557_3 TaxID=2547429 RepID=UPI00105892BB|nr:hypothetical protein [Segetibacter sp. 3557_3]TDH28880.1 hypothetical protein EXU57_02070 [Segetibacter sp. 3557_3]
MRSSALLSVLFFLMVYSGAAQDSSTVNGKTDSSQQLQTTSRLYLIGEDSVYFSLTCVADSATPVMYVNVHDDENTSAEAGLELLRQQGGALVQLTHYGSRNLHFRLGDKDYMVDPNRIYTPDGIKASLTSFKTYTRRAAEVVGAFADTLLTNFILGKKLVIALHNNSEGGFSIRSYTRGQSEAKSAAKVFINSKMDPDDFVLTTENNVFEYLKTMKVNTVLQNANPVDDGSMSVYAAKKGIAYINVEAEHGHFEEQVRMLELLSPFVKTANLASE